MKQNLQTRVERLNEHVHELAARDAFSGTIRVACGDEVLWEEAFGLAHRELEVPNSVSTIYRIGSVTKPFTATAILQLAERGLLRTDETIDRFFPDLPRADQITIHHLLTHSSGLFNYSKHPKFLEWMPLPATLEELIARFREEPAVFEVGESFEYGNSGYILLGQLIEWLGERSYEQYLHEHIFMPLGLTNTGCLDHRAIVRGRAAGYERDGEGVLTNCEYVDYSNAHAAGYLYSTTEDLHRFEQSFYSEQLLKRESLEKMFTPHAEEYGYGWYVREQEGLPLLIGHGGAINGFTSFVQREPKERVSLIWLSNVSDTEIAATRKALTELLFGE